jgi:hypothetical protein
LKKTGLLFVSILLLGLMSGCGAIKDATDISFTIDRTYEFTVATNSNTYSYLLDLNDSDDYRKYKGKIRDVEIDYVKYTIIENTGTTSGKVDFYANVYGGSFDTKTKIAETISVAAGATPPIADVIWLNKVYFEDLLTRDQLSGWAVVEGADIRLKMRVDIRVRVKANVFE